MKLVKLFNKLSAVALAASLVVGFASCSTTTDDPFNPNAPLTLEEYVKSEIKKAIDNGGTQAKPEDSSELEFESRTSLMDKIQLNNEKTEDAWGNGTKISSANPLQASEGYGWDKENGQISLPFAYDAGYFGENTHIIIEADDSALNYNADAAIKIEFKVENPNTGHSNEMNITSKFKDGVAIIPISEIGFTDSCQFLLTFRAKGTVTITKIEMAKAKGQSAPEPTPGEEQKPGENPTPTPDEKPELGKTPGEEYEAGNSTVTSIKLVKNEYAAGGALQTQIKIPSELTSLSVGDKVKVAFKGTADREIGKVELMIVDTTETASWWTALSETKKDTFSTEINFEFVFEITKAPIGTGADSMVFAINGLDSDEAATITCTSFSIEKNADKKPAGGENNAGGEGDNGAGESGAGKYTYTAIWTGEKVMEWSNFNLEHSYFDADVIGVRITYTVTGDGACFKPTVSEPWTDAAGSLDGETTITLTENSVGNLGAVDTNGTVSVLFADGVIEKIVGEGHEGAWGGLTFQGQFVKFTKIETIK